MMQSASSQNGSASIGFNAHDSNERASPASPPAGPSRTKGAKAPQTVADAVAASVGNKKERKRKVRNLGSVKGLSALSDVVIVPCSGSIILVLSVIAESTSVTDSTPVALALRED